MKKRISGYAFLSIALLIVSSPGFAVLTFDALLMDTEAVVWFDYNATGGSHFQQEDTSGNTTVQVTRGDLRVAGDLNYTYRFEGTIQVTPADYAGGSTNGFFTNNLGGAVSVMTINADRVFEIATGTEIISTPVTLLIAEMLPDDPSPYYDWIFAPDGGDGGYAGTVHYDMTGGELHSGSTVRMYDFQATYKMQDTTPTSGFSADKTSLHPQITLVAEIPEPATMVLLGLGGLLLRCKK
jgi:hypothetical protein